MELVRATRVPSPRPPPALSGCSAAPSTGEPLAQPRRPLRDRSDVIYTTASEFPDISLLHSASFISRAIKQGQNADSTEKGHLHSHSRQPGRTWGQAAESQCRGRLSCAVCSARGIKCALAQSLQPSARITEQRFLVCVRQKMTPDDPSILPSPVIYSKSSVLVTAEVPLTDTAAQVPSPHPEESRQNPAPQRPPAYLPGDLQRISQTQLFFPTWSHLQLCLP